MPRKQQKIHNTKQNMKHQHELKSWTKLISSKLITDYAIPITKSAEEQLHKLNEKLLAAGSNF